MMTLSLANAPKSVELNDLVEAFESAWRSHGSAHLSEFLPPPDAPEYASVLCELVRVDLDLHWSAGHPVGVDTYIRDFTILNERRDVLSEIAFEEYRQRVLAGELVSPDEYMVRFQVDVSAWPAPDLMKGLPAKKHDAYPQTRVVGEHDFPAGGYADDKVGPKTIAGNIELIRAATPGFPKVGDVWEGFKLRSRLGSGSFGLVFLAHQADLSDRPVALKISTQRSTEPEKLAKLQHTNIVPVYSVHRIGRLQAVCMPYFGPTTLAHLVEAMRSAKRLPATAAEFLKPLLDRTAAARNGSRTALEKLAESPYVDAVLWIVARITDGLIHAHEHGLLHRDLKPANILLTDHGQPMLLDFNLAADLSPDGTPVRAGGTIPYMAPEQLEGMRGRTLPIDARSDFYSLGVILHELLTGDLPYHQPIGRPSEVIGKMLADRRGALPDPRTKNRDVTPAAVAILHKLIDPDPKRRYATAEQLKEDLERHQNHLPLKYAANRSFAELVQKFRRRNPKMMRHAVAVAALSVVVVLPLSALAYFQSKNYERNSQIVRSESLSLMHDTREKSRTATVLLHSRNVSSASRQRGEELVDEIAKAYGIDESGSWLNRPNIAKLTDTERTDLLSQLGDTLLIRAKAELQDGEDRKNPASKEQALYWHELAATCFTKLGTQPERLATQREAMRGGTNRGSIEIKDRSEAELATMDLADLYSEGSDFLASGNYRKALRLVAAVTDREPSNFMAWYMKAFCHEALGNLAAAETAYTVCVTLQPDFYMGYDNRGGMFLRDRRYKEALSDLNRANALQPRNPPTLFRRAIAKKGIGDLTGADSDCTAALEIDPRNVLAWLQRHEVRLKMGRREEAEQDLVNGLSLTPADDLAWTFRGHCRMLAGRRASNAMAGDPNSVKAAKCKLADEVIEDFDRALEMNPRCAEALQDKAYALSELKGDEVAALEVMNRLIEYYPDSLPARAGRGVSLARLNRLDEALKDADYCQVHDRTAYGRYKIGSLFAAATKFDPQYKEKALTLLAASLRGGLDRLELFATDSDLDPIRSDVEFQRLMRVAKELQARNLTPTSR